MEWADYLRFFAAFGFVIGLMLLLAWLLRRYSPTMKHLVPDAARRRIDIVETLPVDARHRLLLIRRDDVEHLLLIGQDRALTIEGGITPPPGASSGKDDGDDRRGA